MPKLKVQLDLRSSWPRFDKKPQDNARLKFVRRFIW